jgi:hypothetical protein
MQFSSLLVAIFAISVARCAPAPNSTVFTDNARQAQQFNAKFLNLKATDACQAGETACVGGNIAKCVAGKFVASEQCPDGRECLAIPNIQTPGTSLVCTTERNVLGLLTAAGVDGGITGSGDNSTDTSSKTSSTTTSSSTSSTTSLSGIPGPANGQPGNPAVVTVTVTEFAIPQSTTTTPALSGSGSTPSNLLSVGQPPATSTPGAPPLTPAANPSSTSSSASVPTVISLVAADDASNPSPSPTPTSFPVAIQLSAAAGEPTPSPTPSPSGPVAVPVAGGGGGGYY